MPTNPQLQASEDPFAEFGGRADPAPPQDQLEGSSDPFVEFGGQADQPLGADPFAAFGGQADPTPTAGPTQPEAAARGRSTFEQVSAGAARGLKEAWAPYWVTPQESTRPLTGAETAASLTANVGSSLVVPAIGAAIGAPFGGPAGAALGATIASTLYGLYSGIGSEVMRAKALGEAPSPLRAAGHVALEINPLLKSAGAAARAARAAAQVGGAVALERAYGTKDPAALAVAAFGGAVPVILTKGFRPDRTFAPPQAAEAAVRALSGADGAPGLASKAAERFAKLKPEELVPQTDDSGFRRWLVGAPADLSDAKVTERFDELWVRHRPEAQQNAWARWKMDRVLVDEAEQLAKRQHEILTGKPLQEQTSAVGRIMKDGQLVANDVDEKLGTNIVGVLDSFSRSKDAFSLAATEAYKVGARAQQLSRGLRGVSETSIGRALAADWEKIPAAEAKLLRSEQGTKVLDAWRGAFDSVFKQVQAAGYEPGRISNYFPLQALRGADLGLALERGVEQLRARAVKAGAGQLRELASDPDSQAFLKFISERLKKPIDALDNRDILTAPKTLMTQELKTGTGYDPTTLHLRAGELPDQVREWRPGQMLTSYINNNLKAVYMTDAFRSMGSHVRMLDTLGLTKTADFYRRYLQDMSGIARGAPAFLHEQAEQVRLWGRRLADQGGLTGTAGRAAAAVPDFMATLQSSLYPAYLGWNLRAAARNLTQLWATAAPEIGGGYGYSLALRGAMAAGRDVIGGTNPAQFLKAKGQLSGAVGAELQQVLDPNLVSSRVRAAYDKYNELAMGVYSATDTANRFMAMHTAREWARDIISGNARGVKALNNLQRGAKESLLPDVKRLLAAKGSGQEAAAIEELGDRLGDYLISRTQFRYGREQLNEFGRVMGPMFSMFSKWPVMVTSDIVNQLRHQGLAGGSLRVMEKYAAPYLLLHGTATALNNFSELARSPEYRYMIGDPRELSPLAAAFTWDLSGGPLIRVPAALGQLAKEPLTKGQAAARELLKVAPVAGPVLNEIDRIYRAQGKTTYTTQRVRDLTKWISRELGGDDLPPIEIPRVTEPTEE